MKITRALLSVANKEGIADFARGLHKLGIEILSTGGTAKVLREAGVPTTDVSEITGFPELFDGRIKTLHPKIHGGILALRGNRKHERQLQQHGIKPIDLVCVNLYPFEATIANRRATLEEALENIDIGGPALLRAAAKNFKWVAAVCNPMRYTQILSELRLHGCWLSEHTRRELALEAFAHTAHYDAIIAAYFEGLSKPGFPSVYSPFFEKVQELRYGENPHQQSALYRLPLSDEASIARARQHQGKVLSYNNILDADAALELVKEFEEPVAAIIKHNNPCGVGTGRTLAEAYEKALATDPDAAYGGVVAVNRKLDEAAAKKIVSVFTEVVIAPYFEPAALEVFKQKKSLRVLEVGALKGRRPQLLLRSITGGLLLQERDAALHAGKLRVVTKRKPTKEEMKALLFAWKVCKHVKSNAIVFARPDRTIAVGAGQMKRSDSVKIASLIARSSLKGTALASDAFFPFRDGVDIAAEAGATAIIQPGGSVRDAEVIAAADEHNIAMVFTGMRHFKH
ncbi:MAG: bifunctional phosphoribosylaminoimidazolecarboxamide formyltransferase/IMP cyclohydrolase [Candidatus Micrarchaeia archaeon]